jgi:hypothetical protein
MIDGSLKPVSTTIGASPSGLERQHEEARVELDVAQVEDLHFETHSLLLRKGMRSESTIHRRRRVHHRTFG